MSDHNASKAEQDREILRDFHHWIVIARAMVHDTFVGDDTELQRMTLSTAHSLMLEHQLSEIKTSLAEIKTSLNSGKD
ncbi:hypothetical protein [Yoonia sp. I 8.24]|uniref:hypothetical protein n=1 Tax=Yoonia sp. I 8.24 TaxID=1537229 RepID=UPI001EDD5FDF|nr:hypothetical protein [Yoonia sp. I 8.24]MCG3267972.1 hypothetical protein [Yoonia sp. I 8.24]